MGRRPQGAELHVFMNAEKVGVLARAASGHLEFTYDKDWLQSKSARPLSLSMPLRDPAYSGAVVENFFDNLLPDSDRIRQRIQTRVGAQSDRGFDLLWHIGRDCVGAIQLSPGEIAADVKKIEAKPLDEKQIGDILQNYRAMPLGMSEDEDFRISIAGAQEKTALLWHEGRWNRPLGTTPTSHIFKLPIGYIEQFQFDLSDSVENEWLCHLIFKAYEIPVAEAEIHTFNGAKSLVVERFDRRWATDGSWLVRLPQEDMCQALNISPAQKYENQGGPGITKIMELLLGSVNGLQDRQTFMKTQFLFWLLAAIDGHGKNFSLFLLPGSDYKLTPGYDIISAHPLVAKNQAAQRRMKMAMALKGKSRHYHWERILHRHWLTTAENSHFPKAEMASIIDEMLEKIDDVIDQTSGQLPHKFPAIVAEPIFAGMKTAREMIAQSRSA